MELHLSGCRNGNSQYAKEPMPLTPVFHEFSYHHGKYLFLFPRDIGFLIFTKERQQIKWHLEHLVKDLPGSLRQANIKQPWTNTRMFVGEKRRHQPRSLFNIITG